MRKCKILVFSAVAAAAVVAVVIFGKSSKTTVAGGAVSSKAIPVVAAAQTGSPVVAATPPASTNQTPTVRGTLPYVLTSAVPFTKPLRLAAEAMGAKTVSTLSRNAVLVEVDEAARARLSADSRFDEVAEFLPSEKVQPRLAELIAGGAESVDVSIVSLAAADRERVLSCLKAGGGEMLKGCINEGDVIRANLPAGLVASLAQRGDVRWMEKFERPQLMNDQAVEPEAMNVRTVWDTHGLTGKGQLITTSDSGIDTGDTGPIHVDLRDRVKGMYFAPGCDHIDGNGHGTHTAGSIVGDGTASDGKYKGTAYEADLYSWFCGINGGRGIYTPESAADLFRPEGVAAYIHSASWGAAVDGEYTTDCVSYDNYVWNNPEFLPVFSAGNEGSGACTIGSPGSAKNVLTVGATKSLPSNPKVTADFSSRGPCRDGRTKPDIAAPGNPITSTRSSKDGGGVVDGYTSMSGTSMSCPLTAGSVALVRQWLVERKGFADEDGRRPTAALMKAVIMGGAKDATVPNNNQGWGRVDLEPTLFPTDGRAVKLIDRIPFEQGFVTNIVVETTNAVPLDVQLVWVDYPGGAEGLQANSRLVNDLDLTVEARVPGEPTFRYGNGGEEPDTLNNAESVRIPNAVATKYVITVSCKTILHDFTEGGAAALYIRGAFDPDAEAEEPAYVHLKKLDKDFMSLDRALNAVEEDGETAEILDWVTLDNPVTLEKDCTILATNDDASVAYVLRQPGAVLTVTNATVTLSNVVFAASTDKLAEVEAGGRLRLGPQVDLGVDYYQDCVAIATAERTGFDLAGALTQKVLFQCAVATNVDQTFGTYSCDAAVAERDAVKIVCVDDIDRETRGGVGPDGTLVWVRTGVPMDEAAGYFVDDTGKTNTFFRMEKALAHFVQAYKDGKASEFIVRKDGTLAIPFEIKSPLVIRGEGEPRPTLTAESTAGFTVAAGGSLVVSNLVFGGCEVAAGKSFIEVSGGELTLADGAELNGFTGYRDSMSGVVDAITGVVNMLPGSAIVNCSAEGDGDGSGRGGAIYAECELGCTVNLLGGTIANCYAAYYGGGVYMYNYNAAYSPTVNVAGPLIVTDNWSGDTPIDDDIYLFSAKSSSFFRLIDQVRGTVGIRYSGNDRKTDVGFAFITNAAGEPDNETLQSFVNNRDESLGVAADAAAGTLVWVNKPVDDGQCDPAVAVALQIGADGTTNYYASVARAFEFMGGNSPYAVELVANDQLTTDIAMRADCDVTLRSAVGTGFTIERKGSTGFTVPVGATLTLTNILVYRDSDAGNPGLVTNALFNVSGGELTLADGAHIDNVLGNTTRDANAVTVWNGGTLTMLPGSEVSKCWNYYNEDKDTPTTYAKDYGVGGGILVDGATAYLRGGKITNCAATRGGGVYACNKSKVYVSGGMRITGNYWIGYLGAVGGASNLLVEDLAELYVDGEVTNEIGSGDFINWLRDTNLVAKVSADWAWTYKALTNSAAQFSHDWINGVRGVAVTNEDEALVVWGSAIVGGVYTDADGKQYVALGDWQAAGPKPGLDPVPILTPEPMPEPVHDAPQQTFTVTTNTPGQVAFVSVAYDQAAGQVKLDGLVAGADYALYKTNSLAGGFVIDGVKPFTNFTAEADGPCELTVPVDEQPVFWRAVGSETYTTNYFVK